MVILVYRTFITSIIMEYSYFSSLKTLYWDTALWKSHFYSYPCRLPI